jgi:hypothetical protein
VLSGLFLSSPVFADQEITADAAAAPRVSAIWVWDARIVVVDSARTGLLAFCRKYKINLIYLSAYDLRPPMDDAYRAFNLEAHRVGIAVHALAGDPRWGKTQYHHIPMQWIESVLQFNKQSGMGQRFDGIHADIEPYLLSKSWKEQPAALLGGYLDLQSKVMGQVHGQSVVYGVDIPFWFDDDTNYRIEWQNQIKTPTQHILDTVDSITVMAYRNFAEGDDGTVRLVSLELDYGDKVGKKVIVGQETQTEMFPAYISFGGTSYKKLVEELAKIEGAVGNRPSFGGFAIHHYDSYRKLCGE